VTHPTSLVGAGLSLALALPGCGKGEAQAGPPEPYQVVHGWPSLSPGMVLGQVSGVAVDSHGHVFVFHRADKPWLGPANTAPIVPPTILRLDPQTGKIEASFGAGLFLIPHGLRIDGNDHLWITDVGTHQVHELDHDGNVLRSFGVAGEPGADAAHFNEPTDVAVGPDGTFWVADGYGNSRVVKYAADGTRLGEWGTHGSAPGQLNTPHSIARDTSGRLYVADRGNARIQRFDADGKLLDVWQSPEIGRPWAISVGPHGSIFVVDGGDQNPVPPDRGRVLRLDDSGHVLETWSSFGNYDGQIYWGHAIAVSPAEEVFVGDVYYGMRVQKFVRGTPACPK
jgi:peptidylamidoglycolate lyase